MFLRFRFLYGPRQVLKLVLRSLIHTCLECKLTICILICSHLLDSAQSYYRLRTTYRINIRSDDYQVTNRCFCTAMRCI